MTEANILLAWRRTGMHPVDPSVITPDMLAPSKVFALGETSQFHPHLPFMVLLQHLSNCTLAQHHQLFLHCWPLLPWISAITSLPAHMTDTALLISFPLITIHSLMHSPHSMPALVKAPLWHWWILCNHWQLELLLVWLLLLTRSSLPFHPLEHLSLWTTTPSHLLMCSPYWNHCFPSWLNHRNHSNDCFSFTGSVDCHQKVYYWSSSVLPDSSCTQCSPGSPLQEAAGGFGSKREVTGLKEDISAAFAHQCRVDSHWRCNDFCLACRWGGKSG